jgi:hypothetical protein
VCVVVRAVMRLIVGMTAGVIVGMGSGVITGVAVGVIVGAGMGVIVRVPCAGTVVRVPWAAVSACRERRPRRDEPPSPGAPPPAVPGSAR